MANNYKGQDWGYYQAEKERPSEVWTVDGIPFSIEGWSLDWEGDCVTNGPSYVTGTLLEFFRTRKLVFSSPRDALEYLEGK